MGHIGVIPRFFKQSVLWALLLLAIVFAPIMARASGSIDIAQTQLESTEEGYKLSTNFAFELNSGLEEAITHGVPLYFTTEITLMRPRWYWFDEKTVSTSQTTRISYNVLTRQYNAAVMGSLQQNFYTLQEALALIKRPNRWVVAEKGTLNLGATYNVSIRMRLDVAQLSKPFQVNALNNSDWRLSSEWKKFTFKAD
jgi:hypothetical protein